MRIVGGTWRGRKLAALGSGDDSARLRPTTDRVREAAFNTLDGGRYGAPVAGAVVLDLFSGTGALALEALSRGASTAYCVENGRVALKLLRANIAALQAPARVVAQDATRLRAADGPAATLVLMDPPYGTDLGARALRRAWEAGWIAPEALILWEDAAPQPPPAGFALMETRRYGGSAITFLSAPENGIA